MLRLYGHALALNAVKVQLLLEESGEPYEFIEVDIFEKREHEMPAFLQENPRGQIPVVEDGGLRLTESNAILRYVARRRRLVSWYPECEGERAVVDQWLDFALVHVNFFLTHLFVFRWIAPRFKGWPIDMRRCEQATQELPKTLPILDRQLGNQRYIAGSQPTLADLALAPFLAISGAVGLPLCNNRPSMNHFSCNYDHVSRWLETMSERESWQRVWHPSLPEVTATGRSVAAAEVSGSEGDRRDAVLGFWFGTLTGGEALAAAGDAWFENRDPEVDRYVAREFGDDLKRAAAGEYRSWEGTPRGLLALILLLDQFPRHIHRGSASAFAQDALALRACRRGLEVRWDEQLTPVERVFFYLPLVHAEDLGTQREAVARFTRLRQDALGTFRFLAQVKRHHETIDRFGRFPQRNRALGRTSRPEEVRFLDRLAGSTS